MPGTPAPDEQEELATSTARPETVRSESEPVETGPAVERETEIPIVSRAPKVQQTRGQSKTDVGQVEELLASRWMIWLGAIAVALSAVFLFRYAVEQGWLTPMTRVVMGLLLGMVLLSLGEWTLRNPAAIASRVVKADYVPPSLTASGIFAIYVSLYAAHAMFGLLNPATGFVALGLVSWAALGMALRQGWFVGLLGLLAGYLVPALVVAPEPQAGPVFLYLFMLTAGCLGLMIWRKWWWFSALTLFGALFWPISWIVEMWTIADQGILGAYALGLSALFGGLTVGLPLKRPGIPVQDWLWSLVADTAGLGFALTGGLVILLAVRADFNDAAFTVLIVYGAIAFGLALWRPGLEGLLPVAAILCLAGLLIWPQPAEVGLPAEVQQLGTGSAGTAFGPYVVPAEFAAFSRTTWLLAALFGVGGFAGLRRARTPGLWAGLSAAVPVILFALAYWRIDAFRVEIQWASLAAALSSVFLAMAWLVPRMVPAEQRNAPLGLYAVGCTAALALAFACLLREAWLTVAISAEVLALGWIWRLLPVRALRGIATVVTLVVIVRLVLNPAVLEYSGTVAGLFGWVIYGYGLPAIFIGMAARMFATDKPDRLVVLCQIAATGLAFLTVALQLKLWTSGTLFEEQMSLLDRAVQSIWWMVAAGLLLQKNLVGRYAWAQNAGLLVLIVAAAQIFLVQVLEDNPVIRYAEVGDLPLLNLLGLAYLAPALLAFALAASSRFSLPEPVPRVLFGAAGVLVFVYLTLETRRAVWGTVIHLNYLTAPTNAEIYAYSAVWIVYALVILAAGILRRSQALRYASLMVLIVTVAKVFLYDMSDLTGLFRVASFLGLGLTLIGIGRVYQKYVFRQ